MPRPVVVDASVAVGLVTLTPYSDRSEALIQGWDLAHTPLYAPMLWEYEITSVLRKSVAAQRMSVPAAESALTACWRLNVVRVPPDAELHREALRWAARLAQPVAYDAQYLALADWLGAELFTADRRLAERAAALGIPWVRSILDAA